MVDGDEASRVKITRRILGDQRSEGSVYYLFSSTIYPVLSQGDPWVLSIVRIKTEKTCAQQGCSLIQWAQFLLERINRL